MRARTSILFAVVMLAAGCARREQAAREAIGRGDDYLRAGRTSAAIIEYRNAVKRLPTSAEAYRKLGDAYSAEDNGEDAYRSYAAAIELDPKDTRSLVEAGRLLFAAGRYSEALVRAEAVLERNRRDGPAAVLAARALAHMNRTDEALDWLDIAAAADPSPATYAALGDVKVIAGDLKGAETAFRAGVRQAPQSVDARIALGNFLSASGRGDAAEAEYKAAVANDAASESANRALASFYVGAHRAPEAEPYLRAAAARPRQTLRSTLALADFYMEAGRYDAAKHVLEPVTSGRMATDARVRLAAIAFRTGATAEAHRLLDKVMKKGPTVEAFTLNAQILQAEHNVDDALASARAAVEIDPSEAVAQYIIGSIELPRGHFDAAEAAFRAIAGEPQWERAAALQLARLKLASGHPGDAVAFAEQAGDDLAARLTLARALIGDGQISRARGELHSIESDHPNAPEAAVLLGSMALTVGDLREAHVQAARALTLAPDGSEALLLAARTAASEHDTAAAERYLTRAVASAVSPFEAHALLASLYAGRGETARAQRTLEQYIERHGESAQARTALGVLLQTSNRISDARAAYEKALALDPTEPVASNRLARLYATEEAHVARALELAKTAAAGLPDSADAHDTLGWIAFRTGRLSLAGTEVQRAIALNGREPMYQRHLRAIRAAADEAAKAAEAEARARKAAESEQ